MGWGMGLVPTVSLDHGTCEHLFFLQGTCQSEAQVTLLILSNLLPKKVPAKSLQPQSPHHSPRKRKGWRNGWRQSHPNAQAHTLAGTGDEPGEGSRCSRLTSTHRSQEPRVPGA